MMIMVMLMMKMSILMVMTVIAVVAMVMVVIVLMEVAVIAIVFSFYTPSDQPLGEKKSLPKQPLNTLRSSLSSPVLILRPLVLMPCECWSSPGPRGTGGLGKTGPLFLAATAE